VTSTKKHLRPPAQVAAMSSYALERFPILSKYSGENKRSLIWRRGAVEVAEGILAVKSEQLELAVKSSTPDMMKRKRDFEMAQDTLHAKRQQLSEAEEFFKTDKLGVLYENRPKLTDVLTIMACNGYADTASKLSNISREFSRFIPSVSTEEEADNYRASLFWHNTINLRDKTGSTRLIFAAKTNNLVLAKDLVKWNAKIDVQDNHGHCALWYSIRGSFYNMTKFLLSCININDVKHFHPLHLSLAMGNIEAANLLIDNGIDLNLSEKVGQLEYFNPYICFARYYSCDPMFKDSYLHLFERILTDHNINSQSGPAGHTVLMRAAIGFDVEIVKKLIDRGADIKLRSRCGSSAYDFVRMSGPAKDKKKLLSLLKF
jgi:ankyrin repeat protein